MKTQELDHAEPVAQASEASPARLRRRLSGDLDKIVLKSLRKEPGRRYASVEQFSEDIRRHLQGLPFAATPDWIFYRAGKFVRRNKAAASGGFDSPDPRAIAQHLAQCDRELAAKRNSVKQ